MELFSTLAKNGVSFLFLAGSVHPMLTITHTSYSCHDVLEKKSTDSSPSHSQMSRNSSRKSNNSLLVNNGKLEGGSMLRAEEKRSMFDENKSWFDENWVGKGGAMGGKVCSN